MSALGDEADAVLERLDQLIAARGATSLGSSLCPAFELVLPGPLTVWRVLGACAQLPDGRFYASGAYFFDSHGAPIGQLSVYAIQPPRHTTFPRLIAWLDDLLSSP